MRFYLKVEHIMKDSSVTSTREAMEADSVDAGKERLSQAAQVRGSRVWGELGLGCPFLTCAETLTHKAVSPSKRTVRQKEGIRG